MTAAHPIYIVGIGGSAGALSAYKELLDALSSHTGMAFVIISHLLPTANTQLAEILVRHTTMEVALASNAMQIHANCVYIIPPNADLTILDNAIFKIVSPRIKSNNQIDLFLTSLAEAMGSHAIAIILSGLDGDGTEGCRHIKEHGGTTFAQDLSAEVSGMPLSALASGCIDFVLPPSKIAEELQRMV
jgi:two-component system CheB/CheR fusion protein